MRAFKLKAPTTLHLLTDPLLAPAIFLLAVAQQSIGHQNFDNSWLITLAEYALDGGRAYVDFIESNPPASFLLYMPPVRLARLMGVSSEFMVGTCVFAGAAATILLAGAILKRGGLLNPSQAGLLLNAATFVMLFIPGISFAQREHIAGIALLPSLALASIRARAAPCRSAHALIAGLLAGLAICIKPHFVLPVLAPLAYVLARRRSLSPIFALEHWAALAVCLAYAWLLATQYTAYFDVLPMFMDAYVPLKRSLAAILGETWALTSIALIVGVIARARCEASPDVLATPLCAALGFLCVYIIQGKGFPNHGLPIVMFALLAACALAAPALVALRCEGAGSPTWRASRRAVIFGLLPVGVCVSIVFGAGAQFAAWEEHPGLKAAIARLAPPKPRLTAISTQFHLGFPVVRQVGGVWVGRSNGLWLTDAALTLREQGAGDDAYLARLDRYIDQDAAMLRADISAGQPDLILIDSDDARTARAMRHPEIRAALEAYAPLEKVSDVWLWGRKPR